MSYAGDSPFGADTVERRRARRARMALSCTLRRRAGSPIWAETIDVGESGMCVRAARPLQPDELVEFDLPRDDESQVVGRARVMRHQAPRVYGLRFERLPAPMQERLLHLVQGSG
jgi:PilZ domain